MNRLVKLALPLLAVAAMLSLGTATQADATSKNDKNKDVTLKDVDLGTYVHGPTVKPEVFEGRVVVFEYWGDTCGPCLRAIPHLVKLQKEHGDKKLVIVANQSWTKDVKTAKKAWINSGGDATIPVINHGKLKGAKVEYYPQSFIFDHKGKLLWVGNPHDKDFDSTIENAVKNVPAKG